eukprot:TRINITY_DN28937_c0_g1_i1.p1 TRINITY_DN28937_c0_g1~~TRINITY_DN28937_c0_g1_i1.p1  ORF type:complete len:388 (+),score=58.52 TRINITY_DN28937_c0_g1_i1:98-1261(+)
MVRGSSRLIGRAFGDFTGKRFRHFSLSPIACAWKVLPAVFIPGSLRTMAASLGVDVANAEHDDANMGASVCGSVCTPGGSSSSVRVVTYNVRRFKSGDGSSSVDAVADALVSLKPQIVVLNEVDVKSRPEALSMLANRLGNFEVAFFGHVRGHYGNALLSRYRIAATRETHLRGGTEIGFPAGTVKFNGEVAVDGEFYRIARGLLECDLELPSGALITVAATHLDHINESQRKVQLAHILEALEPIRQRALIVGDMNALNLRDYTAEEWAALEARHASKDWSAPATGSLELLEAAGFLDAFVESRGGGPLSQRTSPANDPIFSAHVGHPIYRIDYCFVASDLGALSTSAAVQMGFPPISDHFPVTFDLVVPDPADHDAADSDNKANL